jgi:kynurenine formamidase
MRIRRVIDLSLPIDPSTQVYPGDPQVSFRAAATIASEGFNLLGIEMGSQTGTNCDAPYHFLETGARIDEVSLDLFAGPGVVIDVRGKAPRAAITVADVVPYLDALEAGVIVIFHTGWPRYYGTPRYFDHPYLDAAACQLLLDHGVRTFCLDTQNIDETPDAKHPGVGFPVHLLIAEAGGVIVENLRGVEQIDWSSPLITVFPLRLTGADGSPTRAVAIEFGS